MSANKIYKYNHTDRKRLVGSPKDVLPYTQLFKVYKL